MADLLQAVLESKADKICVVAAPGSGKTTRIIIPKAQQFLADTTIDPDEVLLLTFSRLSALDLKARVKTLERAPRASTVHSFCLKFLLSEDTHEIRSRVECILLEFEKDSLLSDLKLIFAGRHKSHLKKDLQEFSSAWAIQPHDATFEENDYRQKFKATVINWLIEHEAVLMEEIVYHAVDLARKLDSSEILSKPNYIFLDEYQDLNRLEQEFVDFLARRSNLLLVVGDPDQSVYGFKHAHPNGITEFATRPDVESYKHFVSGRCPKYVAEYANSLLRQADPKREAFIECRPGAITGEVHFVRKNTQDEEFDYVLQAIGRRLTQGVAPENVIVLVPKQPLGSQFVDYAEDRKHLHNIPSGVDFVVALRPRFTSQEQERILRLGLLVKPDSPAHIRAYLGIGDETNYAAEVAELKETYGSLSTALLDANPEDCGKRKKRLRVVCQRLCDLREFLKSFKPTSSAEAVLAELFPEDTELLSLRRLLNSLLEPDDTLKSLYEKFQDYIRTIPTEETSIRVMTLMASKGLQADHVYILGCNAGNIPGANRSPHMSDYEYRDEQRRLLYVGFTRAKHSLSVSWSRHIPFGQAKKHHTGSVGTARLDKTNLAATVGLCDFLKELPNVYWET